MYLVDLGGRNEYKKCRSTRRTNDSRLRSLTANKRRCYSAQWNYWWRASRVTECKRSSATINKHCIQSTNC